MHLLAENDKFLATKTGNDVVRKNDSSSAPSG
jgi:hypothetical protein